MIPEEGEVHTLKRARGGTQVCCPVKMPLMSAVGLSPCPHTSVASPPKETMTGGGTREKMEGRF